MQESITASEILDFTYCPRRWYLHSRESQQNDNHYLLVEGNAIHDSIQSNKSLLKDAVFSECEVYVHNNDLNVHGICDRVERVILNGYPIIVPIEIKHGKQREQK